MSCPCRRSLNGCAATSASSSPTSSPCRPSARYVVDRLLERVQPELFETPDLDGGERLVGDVIQRTSAPQCERFASRAPLDQPHEARQDAA